MKSEFAFIDRIRAQASKQLVRDLVCGIGDDAAIFIQQRGCETLITADLLVEDVHFKLEYTPPRMLGHKALAVSLSDIAAMGGEPSFALLTLAFPRNDNPSSSDQFWEEFFTGYFALAEKYGVTLIGGDTTASPDKLVIDSIVMGRCAQGQAVRRSGAKIGDAIFVTGNLGRSATGLKLLLCGERVNDQADDAVQNAIQAHLMPEPRVNFGRLIGERKLANAMMDVSDGLAQDLSHICDESNTAAIIDFDSVPLAEEISLLTQDRQAQFDLAVSGGEDYELLLTAAPEIEDQLMQVANECQVKLTRIGEVIAADSSSSKIRLRYRDGKVEALAIRGYDHFR